VNALEAILDGVPVLPVVRVETLETVDELADGLVAGGLPLAEITLRTPVAVGAIARLASRGGVAVGAGSVTKAGQVDEVVQAGASFVVCPGLSEVVVLRCQALGVPVLPGVATASEIMRALDWGIEIVKLFPAVLLGGPAGISGLLAPFPGLRAVPTGGVSADDLAAYLTIGGVLAVGGSWIAADELLAHRRFGDIAARASQAVATARVVRSG